MQYRVTETSCDVICLQEIKRSHFDSAFLRLFCPASFDCFEFLPSNGASGGSIIIWKSVVDTGLIPDYTPARSRSSGSSRTEERSR